MPVITCPGCSQRENVPVEALGKHVRCNQCAREFVATVPAARSTVRESCRSCGKWLKIPESLIGSGKPILCPACGANVFAPPPPPETVQRDPATLAIQAPPVRLPPPPLPVAVYVPPPLPPPVPAPAPAAPPAPAPPAEPTHCLDCGKALRNRVPCDGCDQVFCSGVCLRRHHKTTGHDRRSEPQRPAHGFRCPYCQTTALPIVRREISSAGWAFFWITLLFLCIPLCWIGLLMKEEKRVCCLCGMKLGA
jgi:hypothetical protein